MNGNFVTGTSEKRCRPCGSKSLKVTEELHLKLLCELKENNICRLSVQPIIPLHHTLLLVSVMNKKGGKKKEEKGLVTVQTFREDTQSGSNLTSKSTHVPVAGSQVKCK